MACWCTSAPQAHEDDVRRAVQSGSDGRGHQDVEYTPGAGTGVRLAVRLGIHTGLVVVGAVGSGGRQEQLALGETPTLQPASRVWRSRIRS